MYVAPRLNTFIRAFEEKGVAVGAFSGLDPASSATIGAAGYDGVFFDMEHGIWDLGALRLALLSLLDRREIATSGSITPTAAPIVRIPANGGEMNQFLAKQALDLGAYGIVWPHINTVEQARNAVAACRYPRLPTAERHDPPGVRGDGPKAAVRYWGLTADEYYARADVWPLAPDGEILVVIMVESVVGIDNLERILDEVPGVGAVLIGEGDLSQELGVPRQYDAPLLVEQTRRVVGICSDHDVVVGTPHAAGSSAMRLIAEGYRLLLGVPPLTHPLLTALTNRDTTS